MFEMIWQRLDGGARLIVPFATTVLFTLLGVVALPLPHFGAIAPPLGLIALYYWTIHRPDLFGPGMAFLVGLLNDAVHGLPLGLSALLYVGAHQLVLQLRRFFAGHSFFMMWSGFSLTVIIVIISEWIALMFFSMQAVPFFPVFMQSVLAIIFFPLPCWLLIRLQRAALSQG